MMGDVNFDNIIDAGDALMIARHKSGVERLEGSSLSVADVNQDNVVDLFDAKIISGYAAGIIDELPVKKGDVNFDGLVDSADYRLFQLFLTSSHRSREPFQVNDARYFSGVQQANSDINNDGLLNTGDDQLFRKITRYGAPYRPE